MKPLTRIYSLMPNMRKATGMIKTFSLLFIFILGMVSIIGSSNGGGGGGGDNNTVNKTWTHPASLSDNISPDGESAYRTQVAMDDNGNAVITWHQGDGNYQRIFKSEYRNSAWTHPTSLTDNISPDGGNAKFPQVAMDDNDNVIITWEQIAGGFELIFKSEYRNGVWSHPTTLDDYICPGGEHASYPQVAMDNNGNAIITWTQSDRIFKSEYRNSTWSHPTDINDYISLDVQNAYDPQVAMDNNGNAIIVWGQSDGSNGQIFKSEYRNSAWTHPTSLSDNISPDGESANYPQVAMDDNGNAIITWEQPDDDNDSQIFKSEYRNGAWAHPTSLSDNISPDGQYSEEPQVAMGNNGNAVITWEQYYQIAKSEYRNGAWAHPTSLSDYISPGGGEDGYDPQVSMDNNGNAIITWEGYDPNHYQVFKSEYRNSAWTHPTSLTDNISPDGGDATDHRIAMDDNGNAIIVWEGYTGSNNQIFMSEYR